MRLLPNCSFQLRIDVLYRIDGPCEKHPQSRIDDLLPWAYPATADLKAVAWKSSPTPIQVAV